jgi:excinuclease UvrABC nuclease subunit
VPEALRALPREPAVFALFGRDARAEPHLGHTPDLRRRLTRLLSPGPPQSRRLELAARVGRIGWRRVGSDFESLLLLHALSIRYLGERGARRLRLRPTAFLRLAGQNPYPRLSVTCRPALAAAEWLWGPFAAKAQAERYCEAVLDLFRLRRCPEDLEPYPEHPGCAYAEMKKCLAPCFLGCTDARYGEEARAVADFLSSAGQSLVAALEREREQASAALEFEQAAAAHKKMEQAKQVAALAPELVRRLDRLRALIVQPGSRPGTVALFAAERGAICGPVEFSTAGMRHANEQSGSSSLFAHPAAPVPVPLAEEGKQPAVALAAAGGLEARLLEAISALEKLPPPGAGATPAHLSLLARWYYRPQGRRTGEIFFPAREGGWPLAALLRGISRVFLAAQPRPAAEPPAATLEPEEEA